MVEVEVPLATRVAGAAEMTVWAALAAPGVKATEVGWPIAVPLSVPVTLAAPAVTEEVSVAV